MRNEISVLALPPDILDKLHRRVTLAAEIPTSEPEMRAFVVVIPKVAVPEPTTHNLSPVIAYEVRYIRHHAEYTADKYGHEADQILVEESTRLKRSFVNRQPNEGELIAALREYFADLSLLQRPREFDSAVVEFLTEENMEVHEKLPHLALE